jgi:hypothetical protein
VGLTLQGQMLIFRYPMRQTQPLLISPAKSEKPTTNVKNHVRPTTAAMHKRNECD